MSGSIKPISTAPNSPSSIESPSEGSKEHTTQATEHPDLLAKMAASAAVILLRNRKRQQLSGPGRTTRSDIRHLSSNACGPSTGVSDSTGSASQRFPALQSSVQLRASTSDQDIMQLPEDDLFMVLTEPYLMDWCFR